jgi:hypothetical protein
MLNENILYRGNVQIHLQGPRALLPIESHNADQVTYFIGSKKSKLLIRDFREDAIQAVQHNPAGVEGMDFTAAFNQPAYAEVAMDVLGEEPENVEIHLRPAKEDDDIPVLWLGVKNDMLMPMLDIEWEILRPISSKKIAFTAMVRFEKKEAVATAG